MRALTAAVLVFAVAAWPQTADSATKRGTAKRDVIRGTPQGDVLHGLAGNDVLLGRQGNDLLYGGAGKDLLRGGTGRDRLTGGAAADQLHGEAGADRLAGGKGRDHLHGGRGNDRLYGGTGNDRIAGGPGRDLIFCGPGADTVIGGKADRLAPDCEKAQKAKETGDDGLSALEALLIAALIIALALALFAAVRRTFNTQPTPEGEPAALWAWLSYTFPFSAIGLLAVVVYALKVADAAVLAVGLLVGTGAFLVGGLFGFIFGIPKSLTGDDTRRKFKGNTSLEEISDWLTKIIIGLTLIQLGELIDQIQRLADYLKPSLGDKPSSPAFALAILMLFSINGFFTLYISTRLYVGGAFARAEGVSEKDSRLVKEPIAPKVATYELLAKKIDPEVVGGEAAGKPAS